MIRTSRRILLGGGAVTLALPYLESLLHLLPESKAAASTPSQRMIVVFAPNGRHMPTFQPSTFGQQVPLPSALAPLTPFWEQLLVVSNLRSDAPARRGLGAGAHARAASSVLTGSSIPTALKVELSVSMDQVLAQTVPQPTRFQSLQWASAVPGACDGVNCIFNQTISWSNPTTPLSPLCNPKLAFEQLFAGQDPNESVAARAERIQRQSSILDYVRTEAKSLQQQLSKSDGQTLDAYLTGVRELERQLNQEVPSCNPGQPPGPVVNYQSHVLLFNRLMVLALKCDLTRIITFMLEYDVSHRIHPFLDSSIPYHNLSHYGNQNELDQLIRIETWQTSQVAQLASMLQAEQVGEKNLLDSTMLYYLPSMGTGASHDYTKMTVALLTGNSQLKKKIHIDGQDNLLANFQLAVLRSLGANVNTLGEDGREVMRSVLQ